MTFPIFSKTGTSKTGLVCTEVPAPLFYLPICAMCISEEHFNGWFIQ
jgi:hypothetical protein